MAGALTAGPAIAGDAKQEIDALNARWVQAFKDKDIAAIEA